MASFLLPGWLIGAFLGRILPFASFISALGRYGCSAFKNAISTRNLMNQFINYDIHGEWTRVQTQQGKFKILSQELFC